MFMSICECCRLACRACTRLQTQTGLHRGLQELCCTTLVCKIQWLSSLLLRQHILGTIQQGLQATICTYVQVHRSDRYLTCAAEKQTGHSFLDVSMAKDVWGNLCKDALMQVWLRSVRLELCLLLHPTDRGLTRQMQRIADCKQARVHAGQPWGTLSQQCMCSSLCS